MTTSESTISNADDDWSALLVRYWTGEVTPEETAQIERWLAEHPDQREQFARLAQSLCTGEWTPLTDHAIDDRLDRIVERTRQGRSSGATTHIIAKTATVSAKLAQFASGTSTRPSTPTSTQSAHPLPPRRIDTFRALLVGAASAAVLLVTGYQWTHRSPSNVKSEKGEYVTAYTTAPGERATVTLPDGSTVALNVSSQLRVPMDYGKNNRRLKLSGEALFTVAHNDGAPFSVATSNGTTRVLGTTFVVRQYPTDPATTVAVRDGKVSAANVVLTAGQEITMQKNVASPTQPVDANRWNFANGILTIADQALSDAIPELNRWYNADIRIQDSELMHRRITGTFEAGSMTDLMWILETGFKVRVVRNGRTLSLYTK